MDDEHFYEAVALELEKEGPRKGLWAKAFAKTGGNNDAAKALYIELRVAELKEDFARRAEEERQQGERQAAFDAEIERQRCEEAVREAKWLELDRKQRYFGMEDEDQLRENLIGRGLEASVAERITRQVFHGSPDDNDKDHSAAPTTAESSDHSRKRYPWASVLAWAGGGFVVGFFLGDAPRHVSGVANVIAYKIVAGITWALIVGLVVGAVKYFKRR